jgi:hypothetical protein
MLCFYTIFDKGVLQQPFEKQRPDIPMVVFLKGYNVAGY